MENKELLKELEAKIKAGEIKIDWVARYDNYNEEDEIRGLYADDCLLDFYELYELFPSRKERRELKPADWRKDISAMKIKENKEFFDKQMKETKNYGKKLKSRN